MKTKFTDDNFMDSFSNYVDYTYADDETNDYHLESDEYSESDGISEIEENNMLEQYYLKHYEKNGWKLDIETKTLYIIFDEPLYFNINDKVEVGEEDRTIIGKIINLTHQYIEYIVI